MRERECVCVSASERERERERETRHFRARRIVRVQANFGGANHVSHNVKNRLVKEQTVQPRAVELCVGCVCVGGGGGGVFWGGGVGLG